MLCPELELSWKNNFTLLGFQIDNRLEKLDVNYKKCYQKVQFVYIASVLDPCEGTYEQINRYIRNFANTGSTLASGNRNWIHQDILYGSKSEGCFKFIDARNFFKSLKIFWMKRYATDKLDDHWADIIDVNLKIEKSERAQILKWGQEAFSCMMNSSFPCIQGFFKAWCDFKTNFHFRPTDTHNNLLHSPIFFNPLILQNPTVKEFTNYGSTKKKVLSPEDFLLTKEVRHRKVFFFIYFY